MHAPSLDRKIQRCHEISGVDQKRFVANNTTVDNGAGMDVTSPLGHNGRQGRYKGYNGWRGGVFMIQWGYQQGAQKGDWGMNGDCAGEQWVLRD